MSDEARVLGLAGVAQAGRLALDIARTGRCRAASMRASFESVLAIDAPDARAVYGGTDGASLGLATIAGMLDGRYKDPALLRIVVTVLHLERKLKATPAMLATLGSSLEAAKRLRDELDADLDELGERLGELYVATISTLKPRVMVAGTAEHLDKPENVTRIRALLLAAIRGAVLWRQAGGTYFNLFWDRRALSAAARGLAGNARDPIDRE